MFRRTDKSDSASSRATAEPTFTPKPDGKGRPTPTRKEAQAAAKERARMGMDKKAARKVLNEKRAAANREMREGMKNGVEKYLPARDQGPVRRYIRDWIDSRITFVEFVLPLLIAIMVLSYSGNQRLINVAGILQLALIMLVIIDIFQMNFRIKRELRRKFPDESLRGTTFYMLLRALQMRFMRMPKPKVKFGEHPS